MAVGNVTPPEMPSIEGVRLNSVEAGIRYKDRDDLALIEFCEGSSVAGCFTQNLYKAAPVLIAQEHLASADSRYLVINSGNANACTGEQGLSDASKSCELVAAATGTETNQVLPFSTGVIGEPMNMLAMESAIPDLVQGLDENVWESVAKSIMTTDTFPKMVSRSLVVGNSSIQINGIAKGAGMIRPDMATMLAYVATDACVSPQVIQDACLIATRASFNRVTVDGDTSTNDAVILAATNKSDSKLIDNLDSSDGQIFLSAVVDVFQQLAQLLVRDGEGATKFVTIDVSGGASSQDCLDVAYCIAHSPLVKTAIYASDPNWGRLVMAIGRSGVQALDSSKVRVWLNDTLIVEKGGVASGYTEEQGQAVFNLSEFKIRVDLAMGDYSEQIWTCDLSHEYVSINADYRS